MNKQYTVFDNLSGGYTVRYRYYDYSKRKWIVKDYQAVDVGAMKVFEKNLKSLQYKFVGRF